ncbi:hypothetical protein BY996DRAFT_6473354 [Phakopsora pachyrhizi]|nr:hypothetical protein BY996DRAFT_6473354 [Phakopsora pachyrhizi]
MLEEVGGGANKIDSLANCFAKDLPGVGWAKAWQGRAKIGQGGTRIAWGAKKFKSIAIQFAINFAWDKAELGLRLGRDAD